MITATEFVIMGVALIAAILISLAPFVGNYRLMYRRRNDEEGQR
ncbi:hypothetical protein [Nonomuraea bangladeshensis]